MRQSRSMWRPIATYDQPLFLSAWTSTFSPCVSMSSGFSLCWPVLAPPAWGGAPARWWTFLSGHPGHSGTTSSVILNKGVQVTCRRSVGHSLAHAIMGSATRAPTAGISDEVQDLLALS